MGRPLTGLARRQAQLDVAKRMAMGGSARSAAQAAGVHEVSVSRWKSEEGFALLIGLLAFMHGIGLDIAEVKVRRQDGE